MTEVLSQLDLERKKSSIENTNTFGRILQKLNRLNIGMSTRGLAKLLMVNPYTVLKWGEAGLIFPTLKGKSNFRHYALKDILRGLTIKYLMSELGFRRFSGVKLVLELTNEKLKMDDKNKPTIDNIHIDRYLMGILNYDIEDISKMKLHGNSKRYKDNVSSDEDS